MPPGHLQILLAVGLAVFCYCLVLGCILCCRRRRRRASLGDKEAVLSSPRRPESVSVTPTPSPCTQPVKQQYEELDGDVLDFPVSARSSSSPTSEDDHGTLPIQPGSSGSAEQLQHAGNSLPMRRLSTPAVPCSPSKRSTHGRASLPSLSRLSLASRSRRAAARRSTVSGEEGFLLAGEACPLQQGEPLAASHYGSSSSSVLSKPAPLLHFSVLFSSACGTLMVNILGLSGMSRRRSGVFARVSLPPLFPRPQQLTSRRRSLSPDIHSQSFVLQVGAVENVSGCTLRLDVYARDFSGLRETCLGVVELPCQSVNWEPDATIVLSRQVEPTKNKLKKVSSRNQMMSRPVQLPHIGKMLGSKMLR